MDGILVLRVVEFVLAVMAVTLVITEFFIKSMYISIIVLCIALVLVCFELLTGWYTTEVNWLGVVCWSILAVMEFITLWKKYARR